ncbi:hypothetical protein Q8A67_017018 [Cirrhinus molitorella]|uniref:Uncharacterized protein n=1 Tax=Cirrhinus molitorella TaxID=172907 RepID=A0AA88PL74_9TELE|nr:hypothetical protein Q8A67_017018 [Cirrhinus molitorella]
MIAITSIMPMTKEQVCRTEMTKDCLSVYTVSCQPTCEVNEITAPVAVNETNDATVEEPYPGPSGFVDTAREGPLKPKSEPLSHGDPLKRAEKSHDRTTFFRGQKVKKGSACPPNLYANKWEAGRPPVQRQKVAGPRNSAYAAVTGPLFGPLSLRALAASFAF